MSFDMKSIQGVLLDITGVLYESLPGNNGVAINGSPEAVNRLRVAGIPFRFVTNESQCSRQLLVDKLRRLGFTLSLEDVFSPAPAIAHMIRTKGFRPFLLVHPDVLPEFEGIDRDSPNCVVVGDAAEHFTFENMNRAFQVLVHAQEPQLFAMGKGKYYKHGGELTLDLGAYVSALEYSCDVKAQIYGKPSNDFFAAAVQDMGLSLTDEILMIGDDIVNDIGGAQNCGLRGALVRTGKFRVEDESHPIIKPDIIINNLSAGVELLLNK